MIVPWIADRIGAFPEAASQMGRTTKSGIIGVGTETFRILASGLTLVDPRPQRSFEYPATESIGLFH